MEEEDIEWLCGMARSGCYGCMTEERTEEKIKRVDKLEKQLLQKRGDDNGKIENKQ